MARKLPDSSPRTRVFDNSLVHQYSSFLTKKGVYFSYTRPDLFMCFGNRFASRDRKRNGLRRRSRNTTLGRHIEFNEGRNAMTRCLICLRAWIAWWRPHGCSLLRLRQLAAAAATMPLFLLMCASFLIYTRFYGPLRIEGTLANGTRLKCQLPDVVQLYVFLFGVWEPDISAFIRQRLSPGDAFVDVGAHVGYHSLLASAQLGQHGRVVAIEASPAIFEQLQANLSINSALNVRAVNVAAAADAGVVKVHRGPAWNLGWTTTLPSSDLPLECEVPALPLDEILTVEERRNVRLIKVDVEGTERALFPGLMNILREGRPDTEVLLELSPRWWNEPRTSVEYSLQPFLDAGFHLYRINNDYGPWRYLWPDSVRPPRRVRSPVKSWIGQFDVVLSRVDRDTLD
jgi:FkbM family methyltransferase